MTTRARVAGPIARATSRGSRFRSSAPPTSQNTGVAPVWQIVFAAATKFRDGTMTSSPGPQPTADNARSSAAVPFATANACLTPQNAAKSRSSCATRGPMLHQPERTAATTACSISSSTRTSESGTTHPCSGGRTLSARLAAAPRPGGVVVAIVLAPSGCDVERRRNRDASRRFDPSSNRLLVILAAPDIEPEAFIPVRADGFALIEESLYEVRKVAPSRGRDVAERLGLEDVDAHADRRGHLGLFEVGLDAIPSAVATQLDDPVVDLDRPLAGRDREHVAAAPMRT